MRLKIKRKDLEVVETIYLNDKYLNLFYLLFLLFSIYTLALLYYNYDIIQETKSFLFSFYDLIFGKYKEPVKGSGSTIFEIKDMILQN